MIKHIVFWQLEDYAEGKSKAENARIIKEGKELGTYMYLFTGGEPLVRKADLIRLCEENPDCAFMSFTNGTLCDDAFADELKRVGNLYLAFSIEGYEDTNDFRRGEGVYKQVVEAMARLKKRGRENFCFFLAKGLRFGYKRLKYPSKRNG